MPWDRPLTGIERWHWLFDRAAPMNLVYVARLDGLVGPDAVRTALDAITAHYPLLAARIVADALPRFETVDGSIDLRVVTWQAGAWRRVAVDEANTRLPSDSRALARATLLSGESASDLILTFHQAVCDAQSGATIVDELLRIQAGGSLPAVAAPEMQSPPTELLSGSRASATLATLREIPKMRRMTPLKPSRDEPPEQRRTGLIDARLPASQTERLALEAAAHGSSVHGALTAAMLLSTGAALRKADGVARVYVGCATSADLRRHGGLPSSWVGVLKSRLVIGHTVHGDSLFWDLAAAVSGTIRTASRSGSIFAYARLKDAKAIGVTDANLSERVAKSERFDRAAAVINNVGRLEMYPRYGDVELQRLGFLVSTNAYVGSALVLNATTAAGTTCLNFTYANPLLTAKRAQALADGVLERLEREIDRARRKRS